MSPDPITYEFSTFRELFDRVPADRIVQCLSEVGIAIEAAKRSHEALQAMSESIAEAEGREPMRFPVFLPNSFKWIDDGKGELIVSVKVVKK